MKAKFFALAALVLGLASCQNDFDGVKQNAKGEVNFELSVAAPDLGTTRAGENGLADNQQAFDSAFGAIDYLQGAVRGDQLQHLLTQIPLQPVKEFLRLRTILYQRIPLPHASPVDSLA